MTKTIACVTPFMIWAKVKYFCNCFLEKPLFIVITFTFLWLNHGNANKCVIYPLNCNFWTQPPSACCGVKCVIFEAHPLLQRNGLTQFNTQGLLGFIVITYYTDSGHNYDAFSQSTVTTALLATMVGTSMSSHLAKSIWQTNVICSHRQTQWNSGCNLSKIAKIGNNCFSLSF